MIVICWLVMGDLQKQDTPKRTDSTADNDNYSRKDFPVKVQ